MDLQANALRLTWGSAGDKCECVTFLVPKPRTFSGYPLGTLAATARAKGIQKCKSQIQQRVVGLTATSKESELSVTTLA